MSPDLEKRIARLAADRESGASEILAEALAILRDALGRHEEVAAGQALCRAQPAMGAIWNAAAAAAAGREDPARFASFEAQTARARGAVVRFASELLMLRRGPGSLTLVTLSSSATVRAIIEALVRHAPVRVACAEGRPALEGRRLASRLAGAGVEVTLFADGAIGHGLAGAEAVLVGADAVAPDWLLNKSGTRMLAAAAASEGIPVYVAASRDKFVSPAVSARMPLPEAPGEEVWAEPPGGVVVRNLYFERIPVDYATAFITDIGLVSPDDVPQLC